MSHRDFQTTVLVRSADGGGHIALVENTVPAGWEGPPLHHHDFDVAFSVLGGELTFARYFNRIAARQAGVDPPPEALEPRPEVVTVGPRIGDRADTAAGVRQ